MAARLRADDGTPTTRVQLCHAQALLRDYLRDTRDPAAEEHLNLGRVEQRLAIAAGPDCATLLGPVDPPAPEIQPPVAATTPAPRTNPPAQPPPSGRRTPGQRALLASGVVGLGVAVAGFSVMSAGIVTSRDAYRLGQSSCHEGANACSANDSTLYDIRDRGELGNRLTRIGAVVGGLAVLAGVTMIVVGETLRRRPRVALTPHLAPHVLGLGLSGRF